MLASSCLTTNQVGKYLTHAWFIFAHGYHGKPSPGRGAVPRDASESAIERRHSLVVQTATCALSVAQSIAQSAGFQL